MHTDFDYSAVPHNYAHCVFAECVRAGDCLRRKVMLRATSDPQLITIINPMSVPGNGQNCPHFHADRTSRFAMGITHLLDDVPHSKAKKLHNEIYGYFQRNTYYRIFNKERLIKPAEQAYIRKLFQKYNIAEEPQFDRFVDQYDW